MAWLDGWSNRLELIVESDRIEQDLANFPVLVTLGSGVGVNNFDATDIFDNLETGAGLDSYTEFMLPTEGDISDSENNIIFSAGAKITTTSGISCVLLNGSSQHFRCPDNADFTLGSDDFTLDMWVNTPSIAVAAAMMSHYTDNTHRWIWQTVDGNKLRFYNDTLAYDSGPFIMPLNEWVHLALVRSDNILYHFMNGDLVGTNPFTAIIGDHTDFLKFGVRFYSSSNGLYFNGYMTKLRYSVGIGRFIGDKGAYSLSGANMSVSEATYGSAAELVDYDLTGSNFWEDDTSPYPAWCKYDFGSGNAKVVDSYTLSAGAENTRMPKTWQLQGSNNDSDWDTLDTVTNETVWATYESKLYSFTNTTAYRYYRMYATAGNNAGIIRMYQWSLMQMVSFSPPEQPQNDAYTKLLYYAKGDQSSSNHDMNVINDPEVRISSPLFDGTAYWYFDGGDHIELTDHADWDFGSGDFTIEYWFKVDSFANYRDMLSKRSTTAYRWIVMATNNSGQLTTVVADTSSSWGYDPGSMSLGIEAGEWYHIALTRENNTMRTFLNGLLVATGTFVGSVYQDTSSVVIGAGSTAGTYGHVGDIFGLKISKGVCRYTEQFSPHNPPNGTSWPSRRKIQLVDVDHNKLYTEIECWDHVNNQASLWVGAPSVSSGTDTVLYLYYDVTHSDNDLYIGDTSSAAALKVWENAGYDLVYHMHQNPLGLQVQSSTGSNHSVPYNFPVDALRDGFTGQSYLFPGDLTNDYLEVTFNFGNVYTIEAFAYNNFDTSLYPNVMGENHRITWMHRPDAGQILYTGNGGSWDAGQITSNTYPPADEWYYSAVTNNAAAITYYLNENPDGSGTYVDRSINTQIHVGRRNDAPTTEYNYDGRIQEFRIAKEIKSNAWFKATNYTLFDNLITYSQGQRPVFTASGTVSVDGLLTNDIPVMLYRRLSGELIETTTTYSGGLFEIDTPYDELHYIISLYTTSGTNALIYDRIAP